VGADIALMVLIKKLERIRRSRRLRGWGLGDWGLGDWGLGDGEIG